MTETIGHRLEALAERLGGKRALAAAAGLSEAQLYRYFSGETELSVTKLLALAKGAGVDPGWLLTGAGEAQPAPESRQPWLRPELLRDISEAFDALLLEWPESFSPRQRARARNVLYLALRHEEVRRGRRWEAEELNMLGYVSFLGGVRSEDELKVMQQAQILLEYGLKALPKDAQSLYAPHLELLATYTNCIVRAYAGYYSRQAGQLYFDRMTQALPPIPLKRFHDSVELAVQKLKVSGRPIDWLDAGCGNGRHLSHLHRHFANIAPKGLELSALGVELCRTLEQSGRLPAGCVTQGDMRLMPYADASFDVVYGWMNMWGLPYFSGTGLGLEEAFTEIARVLRPGGIYIFTTPVGEYRSYILFQQPLNEAQVRTCAKRAGLERESWTPIEVVPDASGNLPSSVKTTNTYRQSAQTVLVKL